MNAQHRRTTILSLLITCTLAWLCFAAGDARAASAPAVVALPAQEVTPYSAAFSARVTANGASTTVRFLFRDDTAGGGYNDYPCGNVAAGAVDQLVAVPAWGFDIKPGRSYSFRFRAYNAAGETYSQTLQFTTPAIAPGVTTLAPVNLTANSARLQASIAANGGLTAYLFQWGVSTNAADYTNVVHPGLLDSVFNGTVSLDVSNLAPNTIYVFRGVAANSQGNTYGEEISFRTAGPPLVETLAAQNTGLGATTLRGTVCANSLATQYYFQFGTTTNYGTTVGAGSLPADPGTNTVTFNATGLAYGQTYHCRLVASNAMGRVFGPDVAFTSLTYAPSITTLPPTNVTAASATLRGAISTSLAEGAVVWFEIGTTTNYGTRNAAAAVPANFNSAVSAGMSVAGGQTYHYRCVGSNSFGIVYGHDVAFAAPPANDACAGARLVTSIPFTHTQSTETATEAGDPAPACVPSTGKGVWFKATMPVAGMLTVDTAGSSFDTVLAIYSGSCAALTNLACNDDVANGLRWSSNRLQVSTGPHYFLVAGFNGASGSLTFNMDFTPHLAPSAHSIMADDETAHAATLSAVIFPGNLPTTAWFVFGTNALSSATAPQTDTSGQPYYFAAIARHLRAGTAYQFQLIASNSAGVFTSAVQTVTTPADYPEIDLTIPDDLIAGTSANSPANEPPAAAIDNDATTKYLNFDKLNAGLIVTPSARNSVRALTLISANDEPARDPASFVLEGSDDGTNFTRITSNAVPPFAARHSVQSFHIGEVAAFNTYRVTFPTVANPATANSMQIAEVELLAHGEITSANDAVSVTLPAGASNVRGLARLFDRQIGDTNKFEIAPIAGGDTVVDIVPAAGPTVLKGIELIGAADDLLYPERRPSSVTVEGSNDGTNFTAVATVTPDAPVSNLQIQEFATDANETAWARYRVTFGPPAGGDRLQVGEMRLFGETIVTTPPALTIRPSGINVLVSWPNVAGFNLETKTALSDASWTPAGIAPVLSNGVNTVTIPMSATTGFFRLRK